jgi:hypothetical protein
VPLSPYPEGDMIPKAKEPSTSPEEPSHVDVDPTDLELDIEIIPLEDGSNPDLVTDSSGNAPMPGPQLRTPMNILDATVINGMGIFDINTGANTDDFGLDTDINNDIAASLDFNTDIVGDTGNELDTPGP